MVQQYPSREDCLLMHGIHPSLCVLYEALKNTNSLYHACIFVCSGKVNGSKYNLKIGLEGMGEAS